MANSKFSGNSQVGNTIERILNQSMRLFLEKGYHGTSIHEITKAAGLTKGALYWHFKSKEDLLNSLLEKFEKSFLDEMIRVVEEVEGGAYDKFEKYIRFNSAFAYYNRELCVSFTTLAAELVGPDHKIEPGIESEIRRIYRKYQEFLSRLIRKGKKEKVFKTEINADLAALVVMALHDGILLQWSMRRDEIKGKTYINTFKKILFNGLMT